MRLISLLWAAALSSCVGAFIVPDQLVSLLTVVYSVIPPIKKGSDSRVGFGYRFGPFADFQVLLELGPQTETQPIGGQTPPSVKRDVDADKTPDIQVLDGPSSNSRSARSGPAPRDAPKTAPAPPPAPPPANQDWLSRWRSSINAAPTTAPAPQQLARYYSLDNRPRPVRAPAPRPTPRPAPRAAPRPTPRPAPSSPQRRAMSPEAQWEAMRRLRSLYWAGQQGG